MNDDKTHNMRGKQVKQTATPKCEICGTRQAKYFETTCPDGPEKDKPNEWKFLCADCGDEMFDYFFETEDFFQ